MPYSLPTSGYLVGTARFIDDGGNSAFKVYKIPWDTDLATTLANFIALMDDLEPLTDALLSGKISIELAQSPANPAVAGRQVEDLAAITCDLITDATHTTPSYTMELPAPVIGVFQGATGAASNRVDTADTDLLAFIANFQTGGTALVSDMQEIDAMVSGKRVHKRSRKG